MAEYYTTLTTQGLAKVVAALSGGPALQPHSMAVGDGGGPNFYDQFDRDALKQRSSLVNQHWSDELNLVDVDPNNPAWVVTEGLIPTQVGGWYIREVGIFDIAGDLIAIGVYPETYKPIATAVEADLLVRSILEVGEASVVQLKIDPSQVMATRAWVLESAIPQALTMLDDAVERAEVARDIAQLAVGIFDTEQEGLDKTNADDYFWVALHNQEHLVALYKNDAGNADFYGTYPSGKAFEMLNDRADIIQRLASQPGRMHSEFYTEDDQDPFLITDEHGVALASWDERGYQRQQCRSEFYTDDDQPAFQRIDKRGNNISASDEFGQPITRYRSEFYTEDDQSAICHIDKNHVPYLEFDAAGNIKASGLEEEKKLPLSEKGLKYPDIYLDGSFIKSAEKQNWLYRDRFDDILRPHTNQYAFYDALTEEFPGLITVDVLGKSTLNNDIKAYSFMQPEMHEREFESLAVLPPVEIVLVSGLHGNEYGSQLASMIFMHRLLKEWRHDKRLARLRWGANIRLIPCANPDGIDAGTRRNSNDVDLNRNFPVGWENGGAYRGSGPASEIETQLLMNVPDLYPHAICYIDHHTHSSQLYNQWLASAYQRDINLAMNHIREQYEREAVIAGMDEADIKPARIEERTKFGGMLGQWVWEKEIKSEFLLEHSSYLANISPRETNRRIAQENVTNLLYRVYQREVNERSLIR